MQGHAIAPDGGPALDDDKRAAGDGGQWRERLGGGDGRGDGDGIDDGSSSLSIYLEESHSSRLILALLKISASRHAPISSPRCGFGILA